MTALRSVALAVASLLVVACVPAMTGPYLRDSDVAALGPDTKATCLVGFQISQLGELTAVKMRTAGGELSTVGVAGGGLTPDGIFFTNVPKGPFRVTYAIYAHPSGEAAREFGKVVYNYSVYSIGRKVYPPNPHSNKSGRGEVPNELSGTCNGGFVWLGEYKGEEGGTFSSPSLKLSHLSTGGQVKEFLMQTRNKLNGSPWQAEFDNPQPNTPLPEGQ